MKKTFISVMLVLAGLCVSRTHPLAPLPPFKSEYYSISKLPANFRGVANTTPFFATVKMKIGGEDREYKVPPGEAATIESRMATSASVKFKIRYIVPDAVRALCGNSVAIKDGPQDFIEMDSGTWTGSNIATGPKGTWYIGGPYCMSQTCSIDPLRPKDDKDDKNTPSSLFRPAAFQQIYDARMRELGYLNADLTPNRTTKPQDPEKLAEISAPIIQRNELWRLPDAQMIAVQAPNGLLRENPQDRGKNIYYIYSPGQITRKDQKGVNQTFAIK